MTNLRKRVERLEAEPHGDNAPRHWVISEKDLIPEDAGPLDTVHRIIFVEAAAAEELP